MSTVYDSLFPGERIAFPAAMRGDTNVTKVWSRLNHALEQLYYDRECVRLPRTQYRSTIGACIPHKTFQKIAIGITPTFSCSRLEVSRASASFIAHMKSISACHGFPVEILADSHTFDSCRSDSMEPDVCSIE